MLISEASFFVVDTETTGLQPKIDRMIEIAVLKMVGGEVVDRYVSLLNPGISVPLRITRMTGISTAMLVDQPTVIEVMPAFERFIGDGILVAHNLTFDLGFLNVERGRMDLPGLPNKTLCTLRLARRLLTGLPSKGLSSVAAFYRIPIDGRHRAAGDASATATILTRFLSMLELEYDMETLEDLLVFQYRTYRAIRKPLESIRSIKENILPAIPASPGVYFFKDAKGDVLYVGKAKSLQSRVRTYFNAVEAHAPRIRKLVRKVRTIEWEETGSELEALLLESRRIKEYQPGFNRTLLEYRMRPFIRLDTDFLSPRISWSSFLLNDGAEFYGPVADRDQAEWLVELINRYYGLRECDDETLRGGAPCKNAETGRCLAPCTGRVSADRYQEEVQRVRDFLFGKDRSILPLLEERMTTAAARMDYETAGMYRDWYQRLENLLERRQGIATPVLSHNAVLVLPGKSPDTVQVLFVRFGRHVLTIDLSHPPDTPEKLGLRTHLLHHFYEQASQPERYLQAEIDEIHILANWLYTNQDRMQRLTWSPDTGPEDFIAEVLHMVERISFS